MVRSKNRRREESEAAVAVAEPPVTGVAGLTPEQAERARMERECPPGHRVSKNGRMYKRVPGDEDKFYMVVRGGNPFSKAFARQPIISGKEINAARLNEKHGLESGWLREVAGEVARSTLAVIAGATQLPGEPDPEADSETKTEMTEE